MNPIVWCDEAIVWGALQCYCYPAQDSGISQVQYSRTTRWGTLEYLLATRIEWAIPSGSQRGLAGKCTSYSSMIFSLAMDRMFTCHGLAEGNISYMYTSQLPPPTPWIPSVPTGLQVMTAARKTIVAADNGGLWKEAVNAVIALVREPAAMRWTMVNQWSTRIWMYLMYLENGGWTGWTQKWHLQWRDDYEILWADKPWELEAYLFFWMDSEMMEKVCTVMKIKACRIWRPRSRMGASALTAVLNWFSALAKCCQCCRTWGKLPTCG